MPSHRDNNPPWCSFRETVLRVPAVCGWGGGVQRRPPGSPLSHLLQGGVWVCGVRLVGIKHGRVWRETGYGGFIAPSEKRTSQNKKKCPRSLWKLTLRSTLNFLVVFFVSLFCFYREVALNNQDDETFFFFFYKFFKIYHSHCFFCVCELGLFYFMFLMGSLTLIPNITSLSEKKKSVGVHTDTCTQIMCKYIYI